MNANSTETQRILESIASGDANASEELFPLVYDELHHLASVYMSRERANHTLQPTALIHEAFLRLTKSKENSQPITSEQNLTEYQNVEHFISTAALVMRRILVNHAKAKKTQKRGGDFERLQLAEVAEAFNDSAVDLLALDEALVQLAEIDKTQHHLVELRSSEE